MKYEIPDITSARIDASTLCQLNCLDCYMRKRNYDTHTAGYLTIENFIKFLDLNPALKYIELSNNGEIFMNPDLVKIMALARTRGIELSASNGVNFNDVSDAQIDGIASTFKDIVFSIDGASQETYSKYRRGGNFDKVIENIRRLNIAKACNNRGKLPRMTWKYIIFAWTEDLNEIRRAKDMAIELGAKILFAKDYGGYVPQNRAAVELETGLNYSSTKQKQSKFEFAECHELWDEPQVDFDGRFMGCGCGPTPFDGNAFETPLNELLKQKKMRIAKKMVMGKKIWFADIGKIKCKNCKQYLFMKETRAFINPRDFLSNTKK